jgi:uncharacterized membrane protein
LFVLRPTTATSGHQKLTFQEPKMKTQSSMIEEAVTTLIALPFSAVIVLAAFVMRSVAWPILRFCGKAALKGLKRALTKAQASKPSVKKAKVQASLPTPDIFKNAPNLAPAKQVRF